MFDIQGPAENREIAVTLQTMAFGGSFEDFRSPYILLLENAKVRDPVPNLLVSLAEPLVVLAMSSQLFHVEKLEG